MILKTDYEKKIKRINKRAVELGLPEKEQNYLAYCDSIFQELRDMLIIAKEKIEGKSESYHGLWFGSDFLKTYFGEAIIIKMIPVKGILKEIKVPMWQQQGQKMITDMWVGNRDPVDYLYQFVNTKMSDMIKGV